jgi:hypothetical protein
MPRGLITTFWVLVLGLGSYFGVVYGKEYYKVKMAETCTDRLRMIETAKRKFQQTTPYRNADSYSDLLPFIPFTGFPMCPHGGKYVDELDVSKETRCTCNGVPEFEPDTPGVDPMKNGYNDLAQPAGKTAPKAGVSIYDFFHNKLSWKGTDKDPLKKQKESEKKLFGEK